MLLGFFVSLCMYQKCGYPCFLVVLESEVYGKPFKYRQHFMRRLCEKAGVKNFSFHAIRHLSATVQYQKGKTLDWLQRFLRHQSANTTQRYLKSLGLESLREGLDEGFKRPGEVIKFNKKKAPEISNFGG